MGISLASVAHRQDIVTTSKGNLKQPLIPQYQYLLVNRHFYDEDSSLRNTENISGSSEEFVGTSMWFSRIRDIS